MAILAGRRESGRSVIRVIGLVVFCLVAAVTGIWGIGIISIMAGIAVVGNSRMRTVQGVKTIMIESRWYPRCFAMTTGAVCG